VIEPRIYRAAFLPAVIAVVVLMFSFESQPPALSSELSADVLFDGEQAASAGETIARQAPDRRPGTPGDSATAERVQAGFEAAGFETQLDRFRSGGVQLTNVIGRRSGATAEQIVVLAPRDADSVPDAAGSATDTATLLELARVLEGRASQRTLVLVSAGGSTLGNAGARRFAETMPGGDRVEAVLTLSDLGATRGGEPDLVTWSNDSARVGIGLERTAAATLRGEIDDVAVGEGLSSEFAHLALPLGVGAQGVLIDRGLDAVRFSGTGELPPPEGPEEIDAAKVGALGRSVLQTISAIDSGPRLEGGPESYLVVAENVIPGWTVSLLTIALILPALIASIDALARARRRREPVAPWMPWIAAAVAPFVIGLLVALALVLTGRAPDAPPAAFPPAAEPLDGAAAAVLGVVAAATALAWVFARPALARARGGGGDPAAPGAACAIALVLSVLAVAVWALNPFAGLAVVPALHLWIVAVTSERRGFGGRILLVLGGLALPVSLGVFYLERLALGPLEGAWYLLLLVTGGQVGLLPALAGCVLLGLLGSILAVVIARGRSPEGGEERRPAVRGPRGYAGPGSLGGTESALRR